MPSRRIASCTGASFPSLAPIPCRNTPIQASETISNCPLLEREAVELSGAPHLTRAFPPPDLNTCHSPSSHFLHPFATPLSPTRLPSGTIRGLSSVKASEYQRYALRNARAQPARPSLFVLHSLPLLPSPSCLPQNNPRFLAIRDVTLRLTIVANSRCLSQLKADV